MTNNNPKTRTALFATYTKKQDGKPLKLPEVDVPGIGGHFKVNKPREINATQEKKLEDRGYIEKGIFKVEPKEVEIKEEKKAVVKKKAGKRAKPKKGSTSKKDGETNA